jgi:hypothetical protein
MPLDGLDGWTGKDRTERTMRKAKTRNPLDRHLDHQPVQEPVLGCFQYGNQPQRRARLRRAANDRQPLASVSVLCRPSAGRRHDHVPALRL